MFAFLFGQALLSGEPGVSQGEYDPLTGITGAAPLQLAGLLQGLDAGLPVSRPVLDPSHVLPNGGRLRSHFDGLLLYRDGESEIPELRVWVVSQGPTLLRQGAAEVLMRFWEFRVEVDGFAEPGDGLVHLPFRPKGDAEIYVSL